MPLSYEICSSSIEDLTKAELSCSSMPMSLEPRPLLIGTSAISNGDNIIIMGGSAVCFSFGTFWNKGCYTLTTKNSGDSKSGENATNDASGALWNFAHTFDGAAAPKLAPTSLSSSAPGTQVLVKVPRVKINSSVEFDKILDASKPVILERLDIGVCTKEWTSEYMKDKVGADREVNLHLFSL